MCIQYNHTWIISAPFFLSLVQKEWKFMAVSVAILICTYVRRSSLHSCYSQLLLLYVPPRILLTHANDVYTGYTCTATRLKSHMVHAVEWHSLIFQSMCGCTRGARPIKALISSPNALNKDAIGMIVFLLSLVTTLHSKLHFHAEI